MKALIALRGSMREIDREHLEAIGYNVTWVDDIDAIRQIGSTSLRDYFAAAALQGILAANYDPYGGEQSAASDNSACALHAYDIADAMISQRSKD